MKTTVKLTHPKIKPARLAEAAKHDIKKYLKRERRKSLPKGVAFWDFLCKFGQNAKEAKVIHLSEVNKSIDEALAEKLESFYIEVLAEPGYRTKKSHNTESV